MDAKNHTELLERAKVYLDNASSNSLPKDAYLQITERCNLKCEMCGIWKNPSPTPPLETLLAIVQTLQSQKFNWVTLWGGEPYLNPDVMKIMEAVKHSGMKLQLITNGTLMTGEKLKATQALADNIVFSVDAPCPEIHDKIRGFEGSFAKVVKNIEDLANLKAYARLWSWNRA